MPHSLRPRSPHRNNPCVRGRRETWEVGLFTSRFYVLFISLYKQNDGRGARVDRAEEKEMKGRGERNWNAGIAVQEKEELIRALGVWM